ncbi:thioredoxin [soil metagenome]
MSATESEVHSALTFTDANFEEEVLKFDGVVLVDFWAEWCGPCRILGPMVEDLAKEYQGHTNVKIGKLDVDANPDRQLQYRIMSIPTVKLFIKGHDAGMLNGVVPAPKLKEFIEAGITKYQSVEAPAAV